MLKESTDLHYDLFPFIKSYIYQAHKTGVPMIRAAFLEAPQDPNTFNMSDAYFFGSEFFVAPIITAGGKRSIYFPEGTKYLEYFNKTEVYEGGSTVDVQIDVHYIPAFVVAGAIVPKGRIYQGNDRWTPDWSPHLDIELYPSNDSVCSRFEYYNGDTDSVAVIEMTSHGKGVVVEYGAVGSNGTLTAYVKGGMRAAPLHAAGGSATFSDVQSLFE